MLLEVILIDEYINTSKDSIIIHTDPNYYDEFFTYDNIAPYNIKILKENL